MRSRVVSIELGSSALKGRVPTRTRSVKCVRSLLSPLCLAHLLALLHTPSLNLRTCRLLAGRLHDDSPAANGELAAESAMLMSRDQLLSAGSSQFSAQSSLASSSGARGRCQSDVTPGSRSRRRGRARSPKSAYIWPTKIKNHLKEDGVRPTWSGSPSSFAHLSFSASANHHIQNKQVHTQTTGCVRVWYRPIGLVRYIRVPARTSRDNTTGGHQCLLYVCVYSRKLTVVAVCELA